MGVIELGLVTGVDEEGEPERARRLGSPREIRRMLVAALAVLCVLALTASAPPHSFAPAALWSIPLVSGSDSYIATGGQVYAFTSAEGGRRRLSAYGLRTGKLLWTVTDIEDAAWIGSVDYGVVMVPAGSVTVEFDTDDGGTGFREYNRETIAIDAASGQQLWRLPGEYSAGNGRQALLTEWDAEGVVGKLHAVNMHDGATAWTHARPAVQSWVTADSGTSSHLVTASDDGLIEVLDFATGTVVASKRLSWAAVPRSTEHSTEISAENDSLIVRNVEGERAAVAAYDLATLTERWHFASTSFGGFYNCGPVMCLNDANGISGYDAGTGKRRWQRPSGGYAMPLGHDRIVIEDGQEGTRHTLIDSNTGDTLTDLGNAAIVWNNESLDAPAYVLNRTTQPPGRTAVGEVDDQTGDIVLRGTIDLMQDYGCQSSGKVLICATVDGRLTVTDVGSVTAVG